MKTKTLEICLNVFENDTKTLYKYGFKNQQIIEKLMEEIVKYHAEEMYEFMFN